MTSQAPSTSLTVDLDRDLLSRLDNAAAALQQSPAWIVEQALSQFLAIQEGHLTAIDEGIQAADAGRLVAHEDVVGWVRSWGSEDERPMPECG